jgi:hypothetical protein
MAQELTVLVDHKLTGLIKVSLGQSKQEKGRLDGCGHQRRAAAWACFLRFWSSQAVWIRVMTMIGQSEAHSRTQKMRLSKNGFSLNSLTV